MKVLSRYLLRQNLVYFLFCMALGAGIYLLTDIFDRLDNFLEAGLGLGVTASYFLVKAPLIFSQIMPAVFLVAAIVMLSLMARSRELLALQAGGVSFGRLLVFFLCYGLAMSFVEMAFTEGIGVYCEQKADRIWKEQVRKRVMERRRLADVWFMEGRSVVGVEAAVPLPAPGSNLTVYELDATGQALTRIIKAGRFFTGSGQRWTLEDVEIMDPKGYSVTEMETMELPMEQKLQAFLAVDPESEPSTLSMLQLSEVIGRLERSGSNVEALRTLWHMKAAYAFSLLIMGLLALAIVSFRDNIYFNVAASLVATFAYYATFVMGVSMGELGLLSPVVAGWLGNIIFAALAVARVLWYILPSRRRVQASSSALIPAA